MEDRPKTCWPLECCCLEINMTAATIGLRSSWDSTAFSARKYLGSYVLVCSTAYGTDLQRPATAVIRLVAQADCDCEGTKPGRQRRSDPGCHDKKAVQSKYLMGTEMLLSVVDMSHADGATRSPTSCRSKGKQRHKVWPSPSSRKLALLRATIPNDSSQRGIC